MRLRRTAVRDEEVVDGELVVMVGDSVLLVNEIAARLLLMLPRAEDGRDVDEDAARRRLLAEFGVPENPHEAWKKLLSQLVTWGLLEVTDVSDERG